MERSETNAEPVGPIFVPCARLQERSASDAVPEQALDSFAFLTLGPSRGSETFNQWSNLRNLYTDLKPRTPSYSLFAESCLKARPTLEQSTGVGRHHIGQALSWPARSNTARDVCLVFFRAQDATQQTSVVSVLLPQATPIRANAEATVAPKVSPLSIQVVEERGRAAVDPDLVVQADSAVKDALSLIKRNELGGTPKVMFSEDGILTVQWRKSELGLALLFAGDGVASIAFRRPGHRYTDVGMDISVEDDLPQSFNDMLATILA
jgi:hypothetical protein